MAAAGLLTVAAADAVEAAMLAALPRRPNRPVVVLHFSFVECEELKMSQLGWCGE